MNIFYLMMMIGALSAISSSSWFSVWISLEINVMSFIPLMNDSNNIYSIEASLKYFLAQALASVLLLFAIIFMLNTFMNTSSIFLILNSALLLKLGAPPFHSWFPEVIEGLTWSPCFLLLTIQKFPALFLLTNNLISPLFFLLIIILSMLISSFMGINQNSLRKILAYSSINHMGWMIGCSMSMKIGLFLYFSIYLFITFSIITIFKNFSLFNLKQMFLLKNNSLMFWLLMLNLMSLSGLPPFLGFSIKWLTIQIILEKKFLFLTFLMLLLTLINLYFYFRIMLPILILKFNEISYLFIHKIFNSTSFIIEIMMFFSIMGMIPFFISFKLI